jgi:rod shape-determining protein MreB
MLTGGGAHLNNLDVAISLATGLKVNIADEPLYCVVKGTGFVLDHMDEYRHLIFRQE